MVPLSEYAVVPMSANLADAVRALDASQRHVGPDRQPHRAVLVVDDRGRVIGKIGQWALLKALEPRYQHLRDDDTLARAGVSHQQLSSLLEHAKFFQSNLDDLCQQAASVNVTLIMNQVAEAVDADTSLGEAMHRLIVAQALSLLVTGKQEVIGVLRLSDLADEAMKIIRASAKSSGGEQE
jgi:CBS domain-containing protein